MKELTLSKYSILVFFVFRISCVIHFYPTYSDDVDEDSDKTFSKTYTRT